LTQKKPFKFETWMLGAAILPVIIGLAIWSFAKRGSVEVGGDCDNREQCKDPSTQCLQLGQAAEFKQVCTAQCSPLCPAGLECVPISVQYGGSFTGVTVPKDEYCFRPDIAQKLRAAK
jgi:hypothetical protein